MTKDKVLIVGAGAIGGFYGGLLAKSGADVSVVCRSDYQIVKKNGYTINSALLGNWSYNPSQIIKNVADYIGKPDYILLCTKITAETNRVNLIQKEVHQNTTIVFIQNGVEIEQELVDAFPDNEIISGLAFICSNRIKPGEIQHLAYGKLTLGCLNKHCHKIQQLSHLINQAGIETIISDDIKSSRWLKCLWNASFNPLSVLSEGLSTKEILSTQEPFIRTIMQEVCKIAQACGHPLPENSIDININNTQMMPPYKTSMLLDYESHQPMEIEVILGNTIRAAKRKEIACPTLNSLYALMKLKELRINNNV